MPEEPTLIRSRRPGDVPVFPIVADTMTHLTGLSKREHFACLLLAGMNANPAHAEVGAYTLCDWAIDQADKLVAKLGHADREDS